MMWPQTHAELIHVQRELASSRPAPWRPVGARPLVAGCFVCFARGVHGRGRAGEPGWAAAVAMRADRHLTGTAITRGRAGAPYQPGVLALREGPLLAAAVGALPTEPEVIIANATGRDHPYGAGLALHLGAVLNLPSIGVTDRPLLAQGAEAPPESGAMSPLLLDGSEVARLLRALRPAREILRVVRNQLAVVIELAEVHPRFSFHSPMASCPGRSENENSTVSLVVWMLTGTQDGATKVSRGSKSNVSAPMVTRPPPSTTE